MNPRIVRQILLVLCFFLIYNVVQGVEELSKLEDMELEKQLKILNKPAIKIVKVFEFCSYIRFISLTRYLLFLFDNIPLSHGFFLYSNNFIFKNNCNVMTYENLFCYIVLYLKSIY